MTISFKNCDQCRKQAGACANCSENPLKNKGETGMDLDKMMAEAFGPYSRPETEEEAGYGHVYQIISGQLVQTEQSKRDQKAYEDSQRREQPIEESWDSLSIDEKFAEAFK